MILWQSIFFNSHVYWYQQELCRDRIQCPIIIRACQIEITNDNIFCSSYYEVENSFKKWRKLSTPLDCNIWLKAYYI